MKLHDDSARGVPIATEIASFPKRTVVAVVLSVHIGLLGGASYANSCTIDEAAHLPAGLSHWLFGTFELYRVNPPLIRSVAAVPVLFAAPNMDWNRSYEGPYSRSEFSVGRRFSQANGMRVFWLFTLARWACIPFSVLGAWVCYRWATDLFGVWSGMLAIILWCFSPNIIGNASLITPDVGAAAIGCLAAYAFWKWLRQPDWPNALFAGLSLGLAELTKSTWIVLFGLWPVSWVLWCAIQKRISRSSDTATNRDPRADSSCHRQALTQLRQLLVILLLAIYLINLGYGFERSFTRLRDYSFISETLSGNDIEMHKPGNRFASTWLASVPVPLPENYVRGIDVQRFDFERGKWSYLRGEQRFGGWWYYYLYALGVKVPIGTWILAVLAALTMVHQRRNLQKLRDGLILLAPAIVVLVLVSSQTGFSRYLRYVLPVFPFAFIWISQVGMVFSRHFENSCGEEIGASVNLQDKCQVFSHSRGWVLRCIIAGSVVWMIGSSLSVYPHSLSYFNEFAGGPVGGHAHLVDANIDWGQDLLYLKRWLDDHPEAKGIRIAYFGFVDLETVGIEAELPPKGPMAFTGERRSPASTNILGPQPGWFAVSVNHLRGYRHFESDQPDYAYFMNFEPVAMAGYSIYIYQVSLEEANRVRRELGVPLIVRTSGR